MHDKHRSLPALGTIALVVVAMLAFAANSLLCRFALQQGLIDPVSFCSLRLVSGAMTLAVFMRLKSDCSLLAHQDWHAATLLFMCAALFSFAYLTLPVGTGALILMAAFQLTMFGEGFRLGERFSPVAWFGFVLAAAGFFALVAPSVATPAPLGTALMAIAGVAWGLYSLRGRAVADPLVATAGNFARAAALAMLLSLFFMADAHADALGVAMAIASGAVTSAMGFVLWYAVVIRLSAFQTATVQLLVPLFATVGGIVFLSEPLTWRATAGAMAILGGIALVLTSRPPELPP
jgi:drug/metabolite transporter (DMT)-like permease